MRESNLYKNFDHYTALQQQYNRNFTDYVPAFVLDLANRPEPVIRNGKPVYFCPDVGRFIYIDELCLDGKVQHWGTIETWYRFTRHDDVEFKEMTVSMLETNFFQSNTPGVLLSVLVNRAEANTEVENETAHREYSSRSLDALAAEREAVMKKEAHYNLLLDQGVDPDEAFRIASEGLEPQKETSVEIVLPVSANISVQSIDPPILENENNSLSYAPLDVESRITSSLRISELTESVNSLLHSGTQGSLRHVYIDEVLPMPTCLNLDSLDSSFSSEQLPENEDSEFSLAFELFDHLEIYYPILNIAPSYSATNPDLELQIKYQALLFLHYKSKSAKQDFFGSKYLSTTDQRSKGVVPSHVPFPTFQEFASKFAHVFDDLCSSYSFKNCFSDYSLMTRLIDAFDCTLVEPLSEGYCYLQSFWCFNDILTYFKLSLKTQDSVTFDVSKKYADFLFSLAMLTVFDSYASVQEGYAPSQFLYAVNSKYFSSISTTEFGESSIIFGNRNTYEDMLSTGQESFLISSSHGIPQSFPDLPFVMSPLEFLRNYSLLFPLRSTNYYEMDSCVDSGSLRWDLFHGDDVCIRLSYLSLSEMMNVDMIVIKYSGFFYHFRGFPSCNFSVFFGGGALSSVNSVPLSQAVSMEISPSGFLAGLPLPLLFKIIDYVSASKLDYSYSNYALNRRILRYFKENFYSRLEASLLFISSGSAGARLARTLTSPFHDFESEDDYLDFQPPDSICSDRIHHKFFLNHSVSLDLGEGGYCSGSYKIWENPHDCFCDLGSYDHPLQYGLGFSSSLLVCDVT